MAATVCTLRSQSYLQLQTRDLLPKKSDSGLVSVNAYLDYEQEMFFIALGIEGFLLFWWEACCMTNEQKHTSLVTVSMKAYI